MSFIIIYDHPSDYSDHFVLRKLIGNKLVDPPIALTKTIEDAHRRIPFGMIKLKLKDEDPVILEVWMMGN